jgi:hypothetical protein
MSAQQLAEEIGNLIISTGELFSQEIDRLQSIIYNRLVTSLKELELDQDGFIIQNASNRRILAEAEGIIDELLPGDDLVRVVSNSLVAVPQIEALNEDYFYGVSKSFNPNRNFLKVLQAQTIEKIEANLLQDGLTAAIKLPLKDILVQNVNTGGSFSGILQQVRNFIAGDDDLDGRLMSYSRGILRDTLFDYSRAFQQSITADLKIEYYMYAGGIIDKTRPFCAERVGYFFHESEVKSWAKLDWQGKRANTTESSIFIYCGGYNCAHSLVPVDKSIVPKDQLKK